MNPVASTPGALGFAPAAADGAFPMAGAALLVLLMVAAAGLILWARSRRGAQWRAPWSGLRTGDGVGSQAPRHLSSLRLDAAHRLHVIAWDNRQFLVATGLNVAPVVVATAMSDPLAPAPVPERG